MIENPWLQIKIKDYEGHMFATGVEQGQLLCNIMIDQSRDYTGDVVILGVASGNGVSEIAQGPCKHIYGYDINPEYINRCEEQFLPNESMQFYVKDLSTEELLLSEPSLLIANLIIEYIGLKSFLNIIKCNRSYLHKISLVIQKDGPDSFVTKSPYSKNLQSLDTIHQVIEEEDLIDEFQRLQYTLSDRKIYSLIGNKCFIRLDFLPSEDMENE